MVIKQTKETALHYQQPYDNVLKALFESNRSDMLQFVVGSPVRQIAELSGEALKLPLRIDRGYSGLCEGTSRVVHVEMETDGSGDMVFRMTEYFGILYKKYRKPVKAVVIYPFRVSVPETSLRVLRNDGQGDRPLLDLRTMKLWEIDAHAFLHQHRASLYVLLPAMKNANYALLSQALDEMKKFYRTRRKALAAKLIAFEVFLDRTDTVPKEEKEQVKKKMEQFTDLMAESPFVKRQKKISEEEGRIEEARSAVLLIVRLQFPQFTELAQQKVSKITGVQALHDLLSRLIVAADDQAVRLILEALEG